MLTQVFSKYDLVLYSFGLRSSGCTVLQDPLIDLRPKD